MRGNLRMALSGVRGSKWRSVLTMTGVIVGIVSVVTVVGIGEGVKQQIAGTLDHFGKNLIIIRPGQVAGGSVGSAGNSDVLFGLSNASALTLQDVETVRKTPGVKLVTPLGLVPGVPEADKRTSPRVFVLGVGSDAAVVLNQGVPYGEFWDAKDEDAQVAVIGRDVAKRLFDEPVPLGRSFTFRGQRLIVRGIFASFPNVPFSPTAGFDDAIFIPYKTAARLTQNTAGLYAMLAKTDSPQQLEAGITAVTGSLRAAHGGQQDFTVLGPKRSTAVGDDAIRLLTTWITAVAAISLFIGGVGIMNIMLLNVTERMYEIGVRKAIGASSRQILGQFVFEAAVLSLLGGIIGIIVSLAVIGILRTYTDFKPVVSWKAVAIATGVSLVVGIVFGAAPAAKAARKDPIEALRHE